MYEAPAGSVFFGDAPDQSTFVLSGHSVSAPYLLIFDRKVPQSNGTGVTTPSYRVRIIRQMVDGESALLEPRAVVDATIRWPIGGDVSVVKAMVALLGDIFSDSDFQDDAIDTQILPRTVAAS